LKEITAAHIGKNLNEKVVIGNIEVCIDKAKAGYEKYTRL
jgi:hypothetical protein